MKSQYVRVIATGCIVIWILFATVSGILRYSGSSYHWLWGTPILIINILNLYFLYQSIRQEPKGIDLRWSTFLISTGASLALGCTSFFISYPLLEIPYVANIRQVGVAVSLMPYPFVIWALLCLNNCLTVLPEAHALVATGIYRYSRHPLYMCYIVWAIANMLMFPSWPIIIISVTEIVLQILRFKREEALLLEILPSYRNYREQTGLIGKLVNF